MGTVGQDQVALQVGPPTLFSSLRRTSIRIRGIPLEISSGQTLGEEEEKI